MSGTSLSFLSLKRNKESSRLITRVRKPIYLVSHSDVKYKGILAGIDKANSTIQLSKVYSMGTENRRYVFLGSF